MNTNKQSKSMQISSKENRSNSILLNYKEKITLIQRKKIMKYETMISSMEMESNP